VEFSLESKGMKWMFYHYNFVIKGVVWRILIVDNVLARAERSPLTPTKSKLFINPKNERDRHLPYPLA
jgi:hypothetical protein